MDQLEPRMRRRGYFVTQDVEESDHTNETDSPEGLSVRATVRTRLKRPVAVTSGRQTAAVVQARASRSVLPAIAQETVAGRVRSASGTGIRQQAHTRR